jgi:hypothetical protein
LKTADAPVRIGPAHVRTGNPRESARRFERDHALTLPGLIDSDLLALLRKAGERIEFVRETVAGLGDREVETPYRQTSILLLALRRREILEWVRAVAGAGRVGDVGGNVVRSWPGSNDHLDRHDDILPPRRVAALTIRLGEEDYEGDEFQMRLKESPHLTMTHHHLEPGDALLFAIAPRIEHRVLPLKSGGPRRIFTGWFLRDPAR